jgi:actin-related protein
LLAHGALAQQQTESKPESKSKQGQDDLDVTMQIIVDPDAKLPDEVVRRIPLPERKPAPTSVDKKASNEAAAEAKQNASEAKELGKKEAAEQREQARRARAEERERNHPPGNPNPPGRPPH